MALPQDSVKISDSANGKARVITITGINIRLDIQEIKINTIRRFFEKDSNSIDNLGIEITGKVDFPSFERQLIANNNEDHLCNPNNGISCYLQEDGTYKDAIGNIVINPVGLFDFFKPLLSQPVAILTLCLQNVIAEDLIYHTWDK